MRLALTFFYLIGCIQSVSAQLDWKQPTVYTYNGKEAEILYRYGDVDNMNMGWSPGYNPFSGNNTLPHIFPFEPAPSDPAGTDRIMVCSGYKAGNRNTDGYTAVTERPVNNPVPLFLKWDKKDVLVKKVVMQLFVDDFQPTVFGKNYQVFFDGERIPYLEYVINSLSQSGPIGKLITIDILPQYLSFFEDGELSLIIDDPYTDSGDGFAIDFVQLLINPKNTSTSVVKGKVLHQQTRKPIAGALVTASNGAQVYTGKDGQFRLGGMTPGLAVISAVKTGFRQSFVNTDVNAKTASTVIILELYPFANEDAGNMQRILKEKGQLDLYGIRFDANSDKIRPESASLLNELLTLLQQNPTLKLEFSGHTDADGDEAANLSLSTKRAEAVLAWLKNKNAPVKNLVARGYGESKPIASNKTAEGKELNRRVEIKVLSQ